MAFRPAATACFVLGKGLSPIWSSTTSLPAAVRRRATARRGEAVGAVRRGASGLGVFLREAGPPKRTQRGGREDDREKKRAGRGAHHPRARHFFDSSLFPLRSL